jgi:hypothetical protein
VEIISASCRRGKITPVARRTVFVAMGFVIRKKAKIPPIAWRIAIPAGIIVVILQPERIPRVVPETAVSIVEMASVSVKKKAPPRALEIAIQQQWYVVTTSVTLGRRFSAARTVVATASVIGRRVVMSVVQG